MTEHLADPEDETLDQTRIDAVLAAVEAEDRDGIQDGGTEVGVEGVTVNLYAANGTTLIATTSTGPNGFYSFDDLRTQAMRRAAWR